GEDWVRVQRILDNNKPSTKKRNKQTNINSLLSGMIICKKCGARMFAKRRSGRGSNPNKYDYICNSKIRGGKTLCDCKNLLGNEVDESICRYLLEYCDDKSLVKNNLEKTITPVYVQSETIEKTISSHKQIIAKKTKEVENLITSLQEADALSSDFIKLINDRVNVLRQEIVNHEQEIFDLQNYSGETENKIDDIQILLDTLKSFKQTFEISSIVQKREALRIIIDRIEWDGENLSVFI
ncbi:MAG: recombinase zinc beta ribbon domain-containing protein, partial [Oscillospiraceae bacterium]